MFKHTKEDYFDLPLRSGRGWKARIALTVTMAHLVDDLKALTAPSMGGPSFIGA